MKRPKAILEANNELEQYEMYSINPLCDHDGDGARQHIATIYDHEEAAEILRLWNLEDNSELPMKPPPKRPPLFHSFLLLVYNCFHLGMPTGFRYWRLQLKAWSDPQLAWLFVKNLEELAAEDEAAGDIQRAETARALAAATRLRIRHHFRDETAPHP